MDIDEQRVREYCVCRPQHVRGPRRPRTVGSAFGGQLDSEQTLTRHDAACTPARDTRSRSNIRRTFFPNRSFRTISIMLANSLSLEDAGTETFGSLPLDPNNFPSRRSLSPTVSGRGTMGDAWTYITPDAKKGKKIAKRDLSVASSQPRALWPSFASFTRPTHVFVSIYVISAGTQRPSGQNGSRSRRATNLVTNNRHSPGGHPSRESRPSCATFSSSRRGLPSYRGRFLPRGS